MEEEKRSYRREREREDGTLCCCLHATIRASEYNNIRISIPKYLFKKKGGRKISFPTPEVFITAIDCLH